MKNNIGGPLSALKTGIAFLVGAILMPPRFGASLGATSLKVEPTDGDSNAATVAVAGPILPNETPGSILQGLLQAKPSGTGDVKVVVSKSAIKGAPARVVMLPVAAADAATFSGGTLLGVITRDDPTKDTSAHTLAVQAGQEADPLVLAIEEAFEAQKPKRNVASLINALADAADTLEDGAESEVFIFSQAGDGSVTVRRDSVIGTAAGKLADVQQIEAEESDAVTPSLW